VQANRVGKERMTYLAEPLLTLKHLKCGLMQLKALRHLVLRTDA